MILKTFILYMYKLLLLLGLLQEKMIDISVYINWNDNFLCNKIVTAFL